MRSGLAGKLLQLSGWKSIILTKHTFLFLGNGFMRNRNAPTPKELPIQTFNSIQQLFTMKGWPLDGYLGEGYFDNFCKMMQPLSEDQQKMVLDLSQEFLWVQEIEYIKYFVPAFDLLVKHIGSAIRRTR